MDLFCGKLYDGTFLFAVSRRSLAVATSFLKIQLKWISSGSEVCIWVRFLKHCFEELIRVDFLKSNRSTFRLKLQAANKVFDHGGLIGTNYLSSI
ncbi:hypothetical protein HanPSC8_Chr10g0408761 [Helianthus annuus]|nr:hypothetical protein HanPSC8_Chr10g0408761 [Helianthus annuus]